MSTVADECCKRCGCKLTWGTRYWVDRSGPFCERCMGNGINVSSVSFAVSPPVESPSHRIEELEAALREILCECGDSTQASLFKIANKCREVLR